MQNDEGDIVAKLRRCYDAFNRGDYDEAMEMAHPEIEFVRVGGQGSVIGAEALRAWMEPDAFEDQRIEILDLRVNGEKVLVYQHSTARGAGSGIEVDILSWVVWTIDEDGAAVRFENYLHHQKAEALQAAGLSE